MDLRYSLSTFAALASLAIAAEQGRGQEAAIQPHADAETAPVSVNSVTDLSHEFSFYADGRFFTQYLKGEGNQDARNWGTLHKCDLSNVNLLVLMSGATPCPYVTEDVAAVRSFLEQGGGVAILGDYGCFREETVYHLNEAATPFGARFLETAAQAPLAAEKDLGAVDIETYNGRILDLATPSDWSVLVRDAGGAPVLARRSVGRGTLLVGSRALFGRRPDAKDPINAAWVRPLLHDAARGKVVDPARPPTDAGWAEYDNVRKLGTLQLHHSDYLQPEADAIVAIYNRCIPAMEELLGVPPSPGMMSALLLLPTGGGGFSSGHRIGLGIWWGGFPDRQYGMMELIGHEGTHSWVLPFPEPMWNEPIATYVGAHVAARLGLEDEGMRVINGAIERARKQDPQMTVHDIAYGKNVPNAVVWGKTMWIWETLRAEKPDILARYFRAKRRLAKPAALKAYTPDDCVAVISHAMERNMFPWFQSLGLTVRPDKATIPLPRPGQ